MIALKMPLTPLQLSSAFALLLCTLFTLIQLVDESVASVVMMGHVCLLQISAASHHLLRWPVCQEEAVLPQFSDHLQLWHHWDICGFCSHRTSALWSVKATQLPEAVGTPCIFDFTAKDGRQWRACEDMYMRHATISCSNALPACGYECADAIALS